MKKKTRSRVVNSDSLFGPPPVLSGEDAVAYDELIGRVYAAIKPADVVDEMLIADVVASEWEFLRWSRLKLSLIQACAVEALKAFLKDNLDYDLYRERFAEDLAEILQENLPEDQVEDRAQKLAGDCAMNETEAVNKVSEILSGIDLDMDDVLRDARINRAEEVVKEYVRRETRAVKLVHEFLANVGTTIDALIVRQLKHQLEYVERLDRLTTIAEGGRNASLREIDRRRSVLGEKLRQSVQDLERRELTLIAPATDKGKDAA
jgi:hypothetical protein